MHGKIVVNENTLAYQFPEIAKEWDYEKNELTPEDYYPHAAVKIWWRCSENSDHTWEAYIHNRTSQRTGCPACWEENMSKIMAEIIARARVGFKEFS